MSNASDPVNALKSAMLKRAEKLATEHVSQGNLSRQKIMQGAREKIHLMEQKELLLAKALSEREYLRKIQSSEIQLKAELDRNRWELVQAVVEQVQQHLQTLQQDEKKYHAEFLSQFSQAAPLIDDQRLIAYVNRSDHQRYANQWDKLSAEITSKKVTLSDTTIPCTGGIKLTSSDGNVMLDNTFEGLISREKPVLEKVIFERLFATVDGAGALLHG
ncbi:MAG: hypothetical protein HN842_10615 [Gammaproteobacteria bacterium]|jgi:V/A-type H+/Na+-transporting ATPase subunit E|nr:hypothetical protein [Gammaproteobacteria bacterium]